MFDDKNMEILTNIIGGVESGGQIYGKRDYSAYAGAYKNSPEEHTCTLGWAQNYGVNAQKLVQMIYDANPVGFMRLDTANIASKLRRDWVIDRWDPNESEKKALISIISSFTGKECQDKKFKEDISATIKEAEYFGVTDTGCIMMFVEIAHLGGLSVAKRIFKKITKPYTVDKIYSTLLLDQKDTSSNNQVGDKKYQTRHECCVKWIKEYVKDNKKGGENMTPQKAIQALIDTATKEIGYLEKASNKDLDSKEGNAGKANYTRYWRDVEPSFQSLSWCACFVSWCFMKTFGLETAKKLLKHWPYTYVPTIMSLFPRHANPKVGDIVGFYRNGEFAHTGIVIEVNGDNFTTIEGNTSGGSTIVPNGGGVFKKTYNNNNLPGTKFISPDYSIVTKIISDSQSTSNTPSSATTTNNSSLNEIPKYYAKTNTSVKVYTYADSGKECSFSPIKKNELVGVCDTINWKTGTWYFIKYNSLLGFVQKSSVTDMKIVPALGFNKSYAGTYTVTKKINFRCSPQNKDKANILMALPVGTKVQCYGYYGKDEGAKTFLYVAYGEMTGYVVMNMKYLSKK